MQKGSHQSKAAKDAIGRSRVAQGKAMKLLVEGDLVGAQHVALTAHAKRRGRRED